MFFNRISRNSRILISTPICPWRQSSIRYVTEKLQSPDLTRHSPPLRPPPLSPLSGSRSRSAPLYLISGTLLSTLAVVGLIYSTSSQEQLKRSAKELRDNLETVTEQTRDWLLLVLGRMKQSGAAAGVLYKSLASLLSSANQEVQKEFELRVAAFVADIVAANESRRSAIVTAGGGAVVDWLLDTVARPSGRNRRDDYGTQAESARALAYLISDSNVCEAVFSRPHAIPNLLRFIFSFQPKRSKKLYHEPLDGQDIFKGRSMLVASIMDIITSNCENMDHLSFRPSLPGNADIRDIAGALEVVEEGGIHFHEHDIDGDDDDSDDGDSGIRSIGMKILGGPTVLGFSSDQVMMTTMTHDMRARPLRDQSPSVSAVPGLWDDLQREQVAVPFAVWALANWAVASKQNRTHIQDLDSDGHAVMTMLMAPERSVKWHGSLVARVLLEDCSLTLTCSIHDWTFRLLSTVCEASKSGDAKLAHVALSAFLVSIKRSNEAKAMVMEKGLHLMREISKQLEKHQNLQEELSQAMEFLCCGDMHLSYEESFRWSGVLLRWIFSPVSSEVTRLSARKILSCILEDYGPSSIILSQGWLAMMLNEILSANNISFSRAVLTSKTDKVQAQIDQSSILSAAQVANQLANTVTTLVLHNWEAYSDSPNRFPLDDFLSLEPFSIIAKNVRKDKLARVDAADSALATLKGIKALTELCSDDSGCQNKIADMGAFSLLRRLLLRDDYEKLAAMEACDASRTVETRERGSNIPRDASSDGKNLSSIQVPPTAHIRKHSARLLMILSLLPKVRKNIAEDRILCKWLEDCANGKILGCDDLKIRSYARATLLNVFCLEKMHENPKDGPRGTSPQYNDMVFFVDSGSQYWKDLSTRNLDADAESSCEESNASLSSSDMSIPHDSYTTLPVTTPVMDVVFIHGLRGGPFNSWRIADNKSSTTSRAGLVEKIDQEAGRQGTCWPKEWLAVDFPEARLFTVKYKTNLTQWSGSSLPLQEVSSKLLEKLLAAGIGNHPVVFVTHSMGGLVIKQMLHQAKMNGLDHFVDNTIGIVFYSCPHFGSKLADVPWRMGYVFRPAPTIGELRSGSPRLLELNEFIRQRFNKGFLDVLSFSETLVTPIVQGYGGWAVRMEVVPIESAYPGFGDIIVLDATDHINSCKPVNRSDPSYSKTLEFLQKLRQNIK